MPGELMDTIALMKRRARKPSQMAVHMLTPKPFQLASTQNPYEAHMNYTNDLNAIIGILATFSPHLNRDAILRLKVILLIAREGTCTSRFLEEALDVNQSTISRATKSLSDGRGRSKRTRTKGLGYLQKFREGGDRNRLRYCLSERGEELIDRLVRLIRTSAIKNLQER